MLKINYLIIICLFLFSCQKKSNQSLVDNQIMVDYKDSSYESQLSSLRYKQYNNSEESYVKDLDKLIAKINADDKFLEKSAFILHLQLLKIDAIYGKTEDSSIKIINAIEEFAAKQSGVEQNILYTILAGKYNHYLQSNLWDLRDRTNVDLNVSLPDKATWDIQRWANGAMAYYEKSLQGEAIKKAVTKDYIFLLNRGFNEKEYFEYEVQSSLYDILANRAVNFYKAEYNYLTKPAERFYIDDKKAFAKSSEFLAWNSQTTDTFSNQYKAIKLYQSWIKFNEEKGNKLALVYADLSRLEYVKDNSISKNKIDLYETAFAQLREQHKNTVVGCYLEYNWIQYVFYRTNENDTNAKDTYELLQTLEKNASLPDFLKQPIESLKNTISAKSFNISLEREIASNTAALVKIEYRNIQRLHYRIILRTEALDNFLEKIAKYNSNLSAEEQRKNIYKVLVMQKSLQNGVWNLADKKDFKKYTTEQFFTGLKSRKYYLITSYSEQFLVEHENALSYIDFQVSNLHYLTKSTIDNQLYGYYIVNRKTGQPIENANVEVYTGKDLQTKTLTLTTDKNGFVAVDKVLSSSKNYNERQHKLLIKKGEEVLESQVLNNRYRHGVDSQEIINYSLFLDRAIYRPGQTLYFKGIAMKSTENGKSHIVLANHKVQIELIDANYQAVSKLELITNEFGSYAGTFVLPVTGMTGRMQIVTDSSSSKPFLVEEYKRPQFYVEMLPIKLAYTIDDLVKVKGKALAYAGNTLSDATVKYRVERAVSFPYWSWRWGDNSYDDEKQEIISGEVNTNEKGDFAFDFKAIADKAILPSQKPEFTYTVYVDVVDITGETHSVTTTIKVGTIAQNISLEIPENVDKNKAEKITITSKNLNGEYEPSKGKIKVIALQTPTQIYATRAWAKPDLKSISEADFKKYFPQFAYDKEDEPQYWEELSTVLEKTYNTQNSKTIDLETATWAIGKYRIILSSKDKYGQEIIVEKDIEIYDSKTKSILPYKPLYVLQNDYTAQPDTTLNLTLAAPMQSFVLAVVEVDGIIVFENWVQISELHTIPFAVEEAHRDRIDVKFYTVKDNRFYNAEIHIQIPYTNKDLKVELVTFRDKLLPGQQEEWKLKITGAKGEKVVAEMLANMYDASLDVFAANYWELPKPRSNYASLYINSVSATSSNQIWIGDKLKEQALNNFHIQYADLKVFHNNEEGYEDKVKNYDPNDAPYMTGSTGGSGMPSQPMLEEKMAEPDLSVNDIQIRTNLKETVFFYPQVQIDAEGNYLLSFTMNEALTKWKLMLLAHTKDLDWAYDERFVVTQKDLMVQPNAPRFFRQGDTIQFPAKISNLTKNNISGKVTLELLDAATLQPINKVLGNTNATQNFSIAKQNNTAAFWKLIVPKDFTSAITYRVIAKTAAMSDGEENALPVVSNRMLVTETMPLPIRGGQSKKFDFKRMTEVSKNSKTLQNHAFTLEFTQNPAWYAVQSLPYLMEYPYECSEQIFSRYYANALATHVINSTPKIKQVFEQWKNIDTAALKSNLHKNQELKYALLEETPWVLATEDEALKKRNMGLLFDLDKMSNELALAKDKLLKRQMYNGGFPWFDGGEDDWYITQYIVQGMAHLKAMNVVKFDSKMENVLKKAVQYCDIQLRSYYKDVINNQTAIQVLENDLSDIVIHYLYTRSFYMKEIPVRGETIKIVEYITAKAKKYWQTQSVYNKGMLALYAHRTGDKALANDIVKSLKQTAINSEEMGMYWKSNVGYYWYEMPIETHTLMIEVFAEVANDQVAVEDLKTWLLKNKQTTHWKTTKATAGAVYALLSHGVNLIEENKPIDIKLGGKTLDMNTIKQEAGTGYFKQTYAKGEFDNSFAKIEVKNNNNVVAWGAAYWQYFEDLDKITSFEETPLQIKKELFLQKNTATGPVLTPMKDGNKINVGDLVKVRVEIRVDRAMEYVHLKDMRAAGFEPTKTVSSYQYKGGLGYYENTRDLSSNFFISYLPKGTYVFEYELRATYKGNFSNGITTMQCMYAPEFTSHSKGIRLTIE